MVTASASSRPLRSLVARPEEPGRGKLLQSGRGEKRDTAVVNVSPAHPMSGSGSWGPYKPTMQ